MQFTDPAFLFYFLPIAVLVLRLTGRTSPTLLYMTSVVVLTLVFYGFSRIYWILIFAATAASTYTAATVIGSAPSWRKPALVIGVALPVLLLACFKYLNWLAQEFPSFESIRNLLAAATTGAPGQVELPPGISFFTFEALSFVVDVYRGKVVVPKLREYFVFLAMFPRFIAGPIVRFPQVHEQLTRWKLPPLSDGLAVFSIGFAMKILGADSVSEFVPLAFGLDRPGLMDAWVGTVAYSIQLYLDFWGYSLMATGIGLAIGVRFPDNFRLPYRADSVREFWRRWHVTLGTWLRDYLYIPLGGSRCGRTRLSLNLLLTMSIGGLWHGANLTFVIWGALHGTALAMERVVDATGTFKWRGGTAVTQLFVLLSWVVFRSASLSQATAIYRGLLGFNGLGGQLIDGMESVQVLHKILAVLALLFVLTGERKLVFEHPMAEHKFSGRWHVVLLTLFVVAAIVSFSARSVPFLYFQF